MCNVEGQKNVRKCNFSIILLLKDKKRIVDEGNFAVKKYVKKKVAAEY